MFYCIATQLLENRRSKRATKCHVCKSRIPPDTTIFPGEYAYSKNVHCYPRVIRNSVGSIPIPKGLSFHAFWYFNEVNESIPFEEWRSTVPKFKNGPNTKQESGAEPGARGPQGGVQAGVRTALSARVLRRHWQDP